MKRTRAKGVGQGVGGGRPGKCTKALLKKAKYFSEHWEDELKRSIPTTVGLAIYCDISEETLYVWRDNPKTKEQQMFSEYAMKIKKEQKDVLMVNGITGVFNPAIAKLLLSQHNIIEKKAIEHSGELGISGIEINLVSPE